jgi:hypothetical protein
MTKIKKNFGEKKETKKKAINIAKGKQRWWLKSIKFIELPNRSRIF